MTILSNLNILLRRQRGEINFLLSAFLLLAITSGVFVGAQTVQKRLGSGSRATSSFCSSRSQSQCSESIGCTWDGTRCVAMGSGSLPVQPTNPPGGNPPVATQPQGVQPTQPAGGTDCSSYPNYICNSREGCELNYNTSLGRYVCTSIDQLGGGPSPTTAVNTSSTDCAGVGGQCILSAEDIQSCLFAFGQGAHYGSGDPKGCPRFDGYGGLCCKGNWKTGQIGGGGTKPTSPVATAVPTAQPTTIVGCKAYSSFEACAGTTNSGCPSGNSCVDEAGNPGGKFCCPPGVVPSPGIGYADLSCLISIGGSSQATLRTAALAPAIKVGDTVHICINIANTGSRWAPASFYNFYASNPAGTNVVTQEAYAPVLNEGANFEYCRDVPVNLVGTYNIRGAVDTLGQVEEPQSGRDNTCQNSFTVAAAEPTTPPTETPVVNQCASCAGGTQIRFGGWDQNGDGTINDCSEACQAYFGPQCDAGTCGNPGSTNPGQCCSCAYQKADGSFGSCASLPGPASGGSGGGGGGSTGPPGGGGGQSTPPPSSCSDSKKDITGACNPACCGNNSECPSGQQCNVSNGYCRSGTSCNPSAGTGGTGRTDTCSNTALGRYCKPGACDDSEIQTTHTCPSGNICCAPRPTSVGPTRVPLGLSCTANEQCAGFDGSPNILCSPSYQRCMRYHFDVGECSSDDPSADSFTDVHLCRMGLSSNHPPGSTICCPNGTPDCDAYCSARTASCTEISCGEDSFPVYARDLVNGPFYQDASCQQIPSDLNQACRTRNPCRVVSCPDGELRVGVKASRILGDRYYSDPRCSSASYSSREDACNAGSPAQCASGEYSDSNCDDRCDVDSVCSENTSRRGCYRCVEQAVFNPDSADVNLDGAVTAVDLGLVQVNYGGTVQTKQGPQTANALMISRILTLMQAAQ